MPGGASFGGRGGAPEAASQVIRSVVGQRCSEAGRDPATIRMTMLLDRPISDREDFLRTMEAYAKAGIELVEFTPLDADPATFVQSLSDEIIPALKRKPADTCGPVRNHL